MDSSIKTAADIQRVAYSLHTIMLQDSSLDSIALLINTKIKNNFKAYQNSAIILNVANIEHLQDVNFDQIFNLLNENSLYFVGVSGVVTNEDAEYIHSQGIAIVNSNKFAQIREDNLEPRVIVKTIEKLVPVEKKIPYEVKVPFEVERSKPIKIISRSIRSGEIISAPNNSIMINGSVHHGARVIATHHVIVNGSLKGGEIYAGNPKDQDDPGMREALISVSGDFNPSFVAIAGTYQTADDMDKDELTGPKIFNNHGIIVSLQGKALCYSSISN